jgi:hypothetical protein
MSDSDSEEGDHASAIMMQQLVKLHFPGLISPGNTKPSLLK